MKKLLLVFMPFLCCIGAAAVMCSCKNMSDEVTAQAEYCSVIFYIDDQFYEAETVQCGDIPDDLPLCKKDGYIFKGWYMDSNRAEPWDGEPFYEDTELYGYFDKSGQVKHTVAYYDGENYLSYELVAEGGRITPPNPERAGYALKGWKCGNAFYDPLEPVTTDKQLYAYWEPVTYTLTFVADGVTAGTREYTVENTDVTPPPVPEKPHYRGEWQKYDFSCPGDMTVYAVYTPVSYNIYFTIEGNPFKTVAYTVEDSVVPPETPARTGYFFVWDEFDLCGGDITVNGKYMLIEYAARFYSGGRLLDERTYNVQTGLVYPDVPEKPGYTFCWDLPQTQNGVTEVYGNYRVVNYAARFIVDGETLSVQTFNAESMNVTPPPLPKREWYSAAWQDYTLTYADIDIYAVYSLETYTATFMDGTDEIGATFFDKLTEISEPPVPQRDGYISRWESYEKAPRNLTIYATHTPITYIAEFYADGKFVDSRNFTVENGFADEPPIPEKFGYSSRWQDYELRGGDIRIDAVYEVIYNNDFEYSPADGGLCVTGYIGTEENIVLPVVHNLQKVTGIYFKAFSGAQITSAVIPDGYTNIAESAFAKCASLERVNFLGSVQNMGELLFYGCENLEYVDLGSVEFIPNYAFSDCLALKKIIIPQSVSRIGEGAFCNCGLAEAEFENCDGWLCGEEGIDPQLLADKEKAAALLCAGNEIYLKKHV